MRTLSLVFSLAGLAFPLSAQSIKAPPQVLKRPPEIEAEIQRLGRFPLFDLNRDGWDDIWLSIFPKVDTKRPTDDSDGDGRSNFEEMLDHQDPFRVNKPMRELTPAQIEAQKKAAAIARQVSDKKKFHSFQTLLQSRGVLTKALPIEDETPKQQVPKRLPDPAPDVVQPDPETSCIDGSILDILLNPSVLLSTTLDPALPRILAMERLSNGNVLLAWEGSADKLYSVEWSDDLMDWEGGSINLPTVNGIGTWGQVSRSPKRFYRVVEDSDYETTISDPLGGNGVTTFGGTLTFSSTGSTASNIATVVTNLPDGMNPMLVELLIDGQHYGYFEGEDGTYTCYVSSEDITRGPHTAYARIVADYETTPSPFSPALPSAGVLRSPETTFENAHPLITGVRLSELEINGGDSTSPTTTTLSVEYPEFGGYGGIYPLDYAFRLEDESGNIVREWTGSVPSLDAGQLDIEWDGTDQNGATLPAGPYYMNFFFSEASDSLFGGPILIKNGEMPMKVLAIAETLKSVVKEKWTPDKYETYFPLWRLDFTTSGFPTSVLQSWGPWGELKYGPNAILTSFQEGVGKSPKAHLDFWEPYNINNSRSTSWAKNKATPANDFLTSNPFNDYDLGMLIGHGVASTGGNYTKADGMPGTKPPQHYFPIVSNPKSGATVWIESANMTEKYGARGRLKWMFIATCNFFRVGAHEDGTHDIFDAMVTAGTLPMGDGLHVLCGYTTSIDLGKDLGDALSRGLLQADSNFPNMTVVQAWNYAWTNSSNSKAVDGKGNAKQIRNARSVYWPECEGDTIMKVPNENITNPAAPYNQGRLKKTDSKFP